MTKAEDMRYLINYGAVDILSEVVEGLEVMKPTRKLEALSGICTLASKGYTECFNQPSSLAHMASKAKSVRNMKMIMNCGLRRGTMIAKGAFSKVYKALDDYGTVYVVKEVQLNEYTTVAAAKQEYNILKQLSHRNIVKVWGFHESPCQTTAEIVMSYWAQGSIHHQVTEFGPLPAYTLRKYTIQLVAGLSYLHNCEIVHRDLKPRNMLADSSGSVALTDFGLSSAEVVTKESAVGSPPYMSPAIIVKNKYSYQSDLWALGCSILEMYTGRYPWSGSPIGTSDWGPESYMYAAGKAHTNGDTPLKYVDDIGEMPQPLRSFLELCFAAEREGNECRNAQQHEYLKGRSARATLNALMTLSYRKKEFEIPLSGSVTIMFGFESAALDEDQFKEREDKIIQGALAHASPFAKTDIRGPTSTSKLSHYNNTSRDQPRMYVHRKRPAHVLLSLLGRTNDRHEIEPGVHHIELEPKLGTRVDDKTVITINNKVIDAVSKEEQEKGLSEDTEFGSDEGPSAKTIYGSEEFEITIAELKRLGRSTYVDAASQIPPRFLSELTEFTSDPEFQLFWSVHRATALIDIGTKAEEEKLYKILECELRSLAITTQRLSREPSKNEKDLYEHKIKEAKTVAQISAVCNDDLLNSPLMKKFQGWRMHVLQSSHVLGFPSPTDAKAVLDQTLAEISTAVCVSQQGYFFVDGCDGGHNQLTKCTPQPVTILTATAIDFRKPLSTIREASRYFKRPPQPSYVPDYEGWCGFRPYAQNMLKERIKETYRVILKCANHHGARNLSMLPMGLGIFLTNVHENDKNSVKELYFLAQYEVLCEQDWGIEAYYLNPGPPDARRIAIKTLENMLGKGSRPQEHLRCDIIFHSCDAKYLAVELAKRCQSAAMLNPADCASVIMGLMGPFWETGRTVHYSGEEDLVAHSTAVLARKGLV
eukprot:TRINITY_DN27606_c0_g1_i1.p1 TRINITY_DN27606_c0_g1~~TRINITY_DN27606_c0_g1_i1.p1  ORF type:complete len:941 (+),score=126.46 TRINITY_DN27606_c0_g1_i1:28-2823(+)